jgi:hypothetical protein
MLAEIRRLDTLARGAGTTQSIIDGLRREAETHDGHLGFSLKAIDGGNLQGAKQHAEHTINVLVGEASPDFGDWDQNKRVENPGDGFGLLAYMRLALAMAESELANPDASSASKAALQPLVDELNAAIRVGEDSQALAQRIASADSIDEMKPLAQEWSTRLLAEGSATAAQQIEATGLRLYLPIVAAP